LNADKIATPSVCCTSRIVYIVMACEQLRLHAASLQLGVVKCDALTARGLGSHQLLIICEVLHLLQRVSYTRQCKLRQSTLHLSDNTPLEYMQIYLPLDKLLSSRMPRCTATVHLLNRGLLRLSFLPQHGRARKAPLRLTGAAGSRLPHTGLAPLNRMPDATPAAMPQQPLVTASHMHMHWAPQPPWQPSMHM
jgi:hypothetical protein